MIDDVDIYRARLEAEMVNVLVDLTRPRTERQILNEAAELFRRHGVPVVRARMVDRTIVFDTVEPQGEG